MKQMTRRRHTAALQGELGRGVREGVLKLPVTPQAGMQFPSPVLVVTKRVVSGQRQGPPAKLLVCFTLPRRACRLSFALRHFRSLANFERDATRDPVLVSWISGSGSLRTHPLQTFPW